MKKLMFAMAAAAGLMAFGDGIESANTVGYNTKAIEKDTFYMIGVQFENVGEDAVADLNKLIKMSGIVAVPYDDAETDGACINVRIGEFYKPYYFINDAYDADDKPFVGDVWADGDGYVITTDDLLALGDGFWFMTKNATAGASLTVAGEVTDANSLSVSFPGDKAFVIRANPFPAAVTFADVTTTGPLAVGYDAAEASGICINVRDGEFYKPYYYINDAYDANDNPVTGDVWADGDGYVAEGEAVGAGAAFWVCSPTAGTLTFSK